jgi:hypothetical protein
MEDGAMTGDEGDRREESRRILHRAERETEGVFTASVRRASRHFAAAEVDPSDRVELWGRRIGRALSLLGVIVLAYLLFMQIAAR